MLIGLERVSGMMASLLLNLEAPFTMLLAVFVFREHLGKRATIAASLIVCGGLVLAYDAGDASLELWGVLALAGACLSWAIDNNLTQRLSLRDPIALVQVKTLSAGLFTLCIAFVAGDPRPSLQMIGGAMLLGSLSYGLSILLDAIALRHLGAAREAAFFATAPFLGALLAIPLLGERPDVSIGAAGALMIVGVVLLLRARTGIHTRTSPSSTNIAIFTTSTININTTARSPSRTCIATNTTRSRTTIRTSRICITAIRIGNDIAFNPFADFVVADLGPAGSRG